MVSLSLASLCLLLTVARTGADSSLASPLTAIAEITSADQLKGVWVLLFKADGCPHCENVKPMWEDVHRGVLGRLGPSLRLGTVDADAQRGLSSAFGITGMPAFLLVHNGKKLSEYKGSRAADDFLAWVESTSPLRGADAIRTTSHLPLWRRVWVYMLRVVLVVLFWLLDNVKSKNSLIAIGMAIVLSTGLVLIVLVRLAFAAIAGFGALDTNRCPTTGTCSPLLRCACDPAALAEDAAEEIARAEATQGGKAGGKIGGSKAGGKKGGGKAGGKAKGKKSRKDD
jgi:hypothetical protein